MLVLEPHIGPFAGYSTYNCCFPGTPALENFLQNGWGEEQTFFLTFVSSVLCMMSSQIPQTISKT
jgi:hypothetical protein